MGSRKVDHSLNIGKKFNYLTVLAVYRAKKYYYYTCLCDCGSTTDVCSFTILKGKQYSCGCMQYELAAQKNKGHIGANRKPDGTPSFKYLLWTYKRNANKRKIEFSLKEDEFKSLTKQNCFFCGQEPTRPVKYQITKRNENYKNHYLHNGVDRLDNNKGYTADNCVPCCRTCNVAKGTQTQEEFMTWVNKIYRFNNEKD